MWIRGRNEGTIYKRKDGRWEAKITVGYDPETGKPKRMSIYGQKREVAEKLARVLAEKAVGSFVEPTKLTFGEWLDRWLKVYVKPKVRPTTLDCYEENIRLHLKPALGHIPLRELRPEHLQALYNEKLAEGLSSRTVRLIHTVAHAALKQAVKSGLVVRNVAEATSPPRQERREMRVLSREEESKLLACWTKIGWARSSSWP